MREREYERESRRVGVKVRDRRAPRVADTAESNDIDAGVEVFADRW